MYAIVEIKLKVPTSKNYAEVGEVGQTHPYGEVMAKKPPLTLHLGSNGLKDDFRTTTNGRADGLLARTRSLSGHPS
ncbi:hypothetical protein J6590_101991 [Homalodisca vitripennis]|nr:hypothetical protein J6590_101991 [Homalodisca vitripennis]